MKIHYSIQMKDHHGKSHPIDVTGSVVFVFGIFLLSTSILSFGFATITWTILAITVFAALHFLGSVFGTAIKLGMAEYREDQAKEKENES